MKKIIFNVAHIESFVKDPVRFEIEGFNITPGLVIHRPVKQNFKTKELELEKSGWIISLINRGLFRNCSESYPKTFFEALLKYSYLPSGMDIL